MRRFYGGQLQNLQTSRMLLSHPRGQTPSRQHRLIRKLRSDNDIRIDIRAHALRRTDLPQDRRKYLLD